MSREEQAFHKMGCGTDGRRQWLYKGDQAVQKYEETFEMFPLTPI